MTGKTYAWNRDSKKRVSEAIFKSDVGEVICRRIIEELQADLGVLGERHYGLAGRAARTAADELWGYSRFRESINRP